LTSSLSNPDVVVPLTISAYTLLQRNLLYTAITGAKRWSCWSAAASPGHCRPHAGTGRRHTPLTHRLQDPGATRP
jgi:exodeoxyribonuclease V alpha subunit